MLLETLLLETLHCLIALNNHYVNLAELHVWSSNVQLKFNHDASMGSKLSVQGDTVVQCVKGDDVCHRFAPNLIKFDVEVAEIEALRGLQHTIQTYQPNLAVSVYHLADHLFSILQMIADWQLNTTFY